jgi:hypothetical protein
MIKLHYGGTDHYFNKEDILTPGKHYESLCSIQSDINEHLPTLKNYTIQCETVSEMGVRYACSTWAFIEGKPKKLKSYDIDYTPFRPSEDLIKEMCDKFDIDFKFILCDSLKVEIENTDLLFIDTLHTYDQLTGELTLHSKNVNKWIILHDTTLFGDRDEYIYEHASDLIKNKEKSKEGLNNAINDFISKNQDWTVKEVYTNCNGLTVLERNNIII